MVPGATEPFEVDARRRIYRFLKKSPGAHFSEVQRRLDLATGTLQYHLQYLEKRDLVDVRRDGRYTRYYPAMEVDRRDKPALAMLRQSTPRQILLDLIEHGPSRLTEISERLDLVPSTLSFHLKKLMDAGVVERPSRGVYAVPDADAIVDLLISYQSSFVDSAVDRIVGLFTGVRGGRVADEADGEPDGGPDGEADRGPADVARGGHDDDNDDGDPASGPAHGPGHGGVVPASMDEPSPGSGPGTGSRTFERD